MDRIRDIEREKMGTQDDDENNEERHPYEEAEQRADALQLEGEERDDYIEARMRRAGYKRGPGAWISVDEDDDDDKDHDDDDTPMTRGDWRRMQREQKAKRGKSYTPPPKKKNNDGKSGGSTSNNPWW